jgi:PAX-interacting protein 1
MRAFGAHPGQLFSGCFFSLSGLSNYDRSAIWAMAAVNGAAVGLEVKSGRTTHLVTAMTAGKKIDACDKRGIKVVTPDWVTDSVRAKELRPAEDYHPRLLLLPGQTVRKVWSVEKCSFPTAINLQLHFPFLVFFT